MAEHLINQFETRVNGKYFKETFYELLKMKGHYRGFDEESKSFSYALAMAKEELEKIVNCPLNFNGFYNIFLTIKNGIIKIQKVD